MAPAIANSTPPSDAFRFVYDADGRLKAAIDPEGDTATYNWDTGGNLLSIGRASSGKLSILRLSPARARVGETIEIQGTGFAETPASNTVKFNGTAATAEAATPWSLSVKVPAGATSGTVTVQTPGEGPVVSEEAFTVAGSVEPAISALEPSVASGGAEVTIAGSNFGSTPSDNAVSFNGSWPEVVSASTSAIKFKVPANRLGGPVTVSTDQGSSAGVDLFVPPAGPTSKVGSTGRLSVGGGSKTATFAGSEKVVLLLFDGTAGQRLGLSLSESSISSGGVSIWSPSKTQIASAGFSKASGGFVEVASLPVTGTYTVMLTPDGSSAGSVKVAAHSPAVVTGSIVPTATLKGATQHVELTTPSQIARYSVTMTAGERVALKTTNSAFNGIYWIRWLNPNGTTAYQTWWSPTENWFWNPKTFPSAGTYTLEVDPEAGSTGSVDLVLWEVPADLTGQTITPTNEGETKTSTTTIPGQREMITFSGAKDAKVAWKSFGSSITGTISILRPNGAELSGGSGSFSQFHEVVTLPETGTYTFVLDPESDKVGTVKLTAYKGDDITGSITPEATVAGTKQKVAIGIPGQVARYSVTMTAGERVALKTTNSAFSNSYSIKWLNSKGETVYSQSWNGPENWFWNPKTFSSAGTYTLLVDPDGTGTGSVDLVLWEVPADPTGSITPTTEGESKTFSLSIPGQRQLVTFAGTSGQTVTMKAPESTIAEGVMSILKPDGSQLGSSSTFKTSTAARIEASLPTTGTYTVVLDPLFDNTGNVKLTAYLGSHVALLRPFEPSTQLVSLAGPPLGSIGFSDIPAGSSQFPVEVDRADGITPEMQAFDPADVRVWHPPRDIPGWEAAEPKTPWAEAEDLRAPTGTTALSGQVLERNGLPIGGIRVFVEGTSVDARTDEAGRFLLEGLPAGKQALVVDGESLQGDRRFGSYEVNVDLENRQTTVLDYTIWLSPLDPAGDQQVASPTEHETRLTTPSIPGLEVRIPAGTVIRNAAGKEVGDLNITAIPVNQAPFPLPPFVPIPVYFTIQPGRAYLSKGAQIVYPNWGDLRPGQRAEFWNYDPQDQGWYVYGRGTVSADGKQVVPDPGVRVWQFTGAMLAGSPLPPGSSPTGASGGDPVDLYSGLFTYHKRDLILPDSIPIDIQRTYRPADSNSYSFGIGTTNRYDMRLWSGAEGAEANLIMPDGHPIHFVRTTPGTAYSTGIYESRSTPGPFFGATLKYNPSAGGAYWDMKLKDGTTYVFGVGRLLEVRDPHGNRLTITRSGEDITEITSPHGRWVKFSYDGSHRITEITDNGGRHFKYTYTSGRLTKVEAPGGRTTKYEYDGSGRMNAVVNARGNKYVQVSYDANGRVEKQTTADGGVFEFDYDLDEAGKVEATTLTDPIGNQRKVEFNSEGRQISETEAPGTELEQTTDLELQPETGLVLSKTDPLGRETEFEYDSVGNLAEITKLAGTEDAVTTSFDYQPGTDRLTQITDPLGHTTEFEYGAHGELLKRTDALENETAFAYNSEGQPISVTNPEEEETDFGYTNGDLTSVTDPLSRTTRQFVDGLGRVRSLASPGGQRTIFAYNEAGEVTAVTRPSGAQTQIGRDADGNVVSVTDPRENETTMTYDAMDRLESETNPLEDAAERSYDKAGHLTEEVSRSGKVNEFTYDALGRLAKASYGVEGEVAESTIEYQYDDADRLVGVDDSASGEYVLDYDELDRLTEITGPQGTVGYLYDDAGRRTAMALPGQEPLVYEYDDANRLTGLARGAESVSVAYDDADRLAVLTLPNGIEQLYGHDQAGQVTSIAYKHGETPLGEIDYSYDLNGRTSAMWGSYARLDLPEPLAAGTYNAANQLVERGEEEFSYDADGSLLGDGANEYEWDARGQLVGIEGEVDASFTYDAFGRRTSKTLGETTTEMLYDGANIAQEYSGEELTASVLSGLQMDQLFSRTTSAGADSYLTDRLGSVIALANSSGEVETTYSYEPFGEPSSAGAESDNPFEFTGRETDGTGLQFNRARYYGPALGRFISEDPAGFAGSGTNLYWYANGDPLKYIDPTGQSGIVVAIPDPLGALEDGLESAGNKVGDWVNDAPGVASDAAEWVEGAEATVGNVAGTTWNEGYRTFWCIAEAVAKQEDEIGCYQKHNELEEPEEPEDRFPPPSGPPVVTNPTTTTKPTTIPPP
jgi:RHS repeat-associated protein